jgi:ferredoxin
MSELLPEMNPITFTISYQGQELPVRTYQNQYFSLMSLIVDKLQIQGFGMCSGMGSCGTCLLNIYHNKSTFERATLSCQIAIDDELANVKIVLPDKIY